MHQVKVKFYQPCRGPFAAGLGSRWRYTRRATRKFNSRIPAISQPYPHNTAAVPTSPDTGGH